MKKVESLTEFQTLVREFRKSNGKMKTNCFFVPSEVRRLVETSVLFTDHSEGALYFYVKETGCLRFYYYIAEHAKMQTEQTETSLLCDITFRGEEAVALEKTGAAGLCEAGFLKYKTYLRMEIPKEHVMAEQSERECQYLIEKLSESDYASVLKLWLQGLDEYSTPLPSQEEFGMVCRDGGVFGIFDEGHELSGVCQLSFHGKAVLFEHLTVNPSKRKSGIGTALFQAALEEVFKNRELERMNLWVDEKNQKARRIYEKNGMSSDGLISVQYIKEAAKEQAEER